MHFGVAIDAFLRSCVVERRLSPHTSQAYRFDLADFQKWGSAHANLENVTTTTLKSYMEDMTRRKLATSTIRRRLACLRAFFRFMSDYGGDSNPFDGWHLRLARRRQLPRTLSRAEVSSLLSISAYAGELLKNKDDSLGTVVRLMISTGLRVGEVCKLRTEDVLSGGGSLRVKGKGARDRIAYVSDQDLSNDLQKLVTLRGKNAPLFLNRIGLGLKPQSVRLKLRRLAEERGLTRRLTAHMLRHTAATLLIETGVDIRFVQRLLGHSSISTTEIYTHVSDEALRTTLAKAGVLRTLV
jgi:site-specific recombinase XerD